MLQGPIAFASTLDEEGNVNLSPFSFFNCFGSNPPILVFSPSRRVRDNTLKHTLLNAESTGEVVINIVNYAIVGQMSLSSTEYGDGINEFIKSGLTEVPSEKVKPPRVLESPVSFECKVVNIVALGEEGGAGNLIICEVLLAHYHENVLDENGKVDPYALDAVGRMGGDWYCRAQGDAIFKWPKPSAEKGMGMDQLPESIRNSSVLSGNELSQLANFAELPDPEAIIAFAENEEGREIRERFRNDPDEMAWKFHDLAKNLISKGELEKAWLVVMQGSGS